MSFTLEGRFKDKFDELATHYRNSDNEPAKEEALAALRTLYVGYSKARLNRRDRRGILGFVFGSVGETWGRYVAEEAIQRMASYLRMRAPDIAEQVIEPALQRVFPPSRYEYGGERKLNNELRERRLY